MQAPGLKVGLQSLLGYLPAIVIQKILDGEIDSSKNLPAYHKIETVSLFADISGFTKLSESFSKKGRIGPEFLAFSLNRYMEQLSKNGGDIFKFAGDAILVVWPPVSRIEESCQRAIQCALDIQGKLNNQEISPNKRLSVKIGIGVGECTILVVGGQFGRCEYLCVGDALAQACESETKATEGGQTICSEDVFRYIQLKFECHEVTGGDDHGHGPSESDMKFYKIVKLTGDRVQIKADAFLMRTKFSLDKLREKLSVLKAFVPASIVKYLEIEKEVWSKEIRLISTMFLNLKVDLKQTKSHEGIQRIQKIVRMVQRCVYLTKGSLNKFLMDDKGSVMVISWGLPPLSAPDDHTRAVLCSQTLITELKNFNCGAYFGISTGTCFTGVCGTIGGRREYSLLGEIVNLSARHMQKAIYHAKESSSPNNEVDYLCLIDERTKDLIQNKIFSEYVCKGELKGFMNEFNFYKPLEDNRSTHDFSMNLFPEIKTHNHNIQIYERKRDMKNLINKSLFLIGYRDEIDNCKKLIKNVYKNEESVKILVRGVFGSGKSLFCRKLLYEFFDQNKELKLSLIEFSKELPFVLVSYQTPTTTYNPFNGWQTIFREIYNKIIIELEKKSETKNYYELLIGGDKILINCDFFGRILLKTNNYSNMKYIEEILGINFINHIDVPEENENFDKYFIIKNLKERDPFFIPIYFDKNESSICKFFIKMIKKYREILDESIYEENYKYPLIFVIEDCQLIDSISVDFISLLNENEKKIAIICTYQDKISPLLENKYDKFGSKLLNSFGENVVSLENITSFSDCHELIKQHLQGRLNLSSMDNELISIILPKTFKGNPLFILDIIESLIESNKYVQHAGHELLSTSELLEMHEDQDWINFNIPIRMEKLIGHIIDTLNCKEIILLKYAATIGNIFDIEKLSKLNPFENVTFEDLFTLLQRLEIEGLIEILYDLEPKKMICKFAIPFCREILYQRMLIEQRNDIHMNIARHMQFNKFSYMTSKKELNQLKLHLRKTEKSIINYMEEEDDNEVFLRDETKFSSNTNQKIVLVKEICQKLKINDLKLEEEEHFNKRIQKIVEGILSKKSDANITWENRYIVITNKRFYYYYTDMDYVENKEPLGFFEMKNLYNLEIIPDYTYGRRKNIFTITVSQWQKKDQIKPGRSYILSTDSKEKLNDWITSINFLRVKATYDEFTCQFGKLKLPLTHEIIKSNMKIKKKLIPNNLNVKKDLRKSSKNYFNSIARKSMILKIDQNIVKSRHFSLKEINSSFNLLQDLNYDEDNLMKTTKLKNNLSNLFSFGFVCLFAFISDIIFNVDEFGNSEAKIIYIPKFIHNYLDLKNEMIDIHKNSFNVNIGAEIIGNKNNLSLKNEIQKDIDENLSSSIRNLNTKPIETISNVEKGIEIKNHPRSFTVIDIQIPEEIIQAVEKPKNDLINENDCEKIDNNNYSPIKSENIKLNMNVTSTNKIKKYMKLENENEIAKKLNTFRKNMEEVTSKNQIHYSKLVDEIKEEKDNIDKDNNSNNLQYNDDLMNKKYTKYSSSIFKSKKNI